MGKYYAQLTEQKTQTNPRFYIECLVTLNHIFSVNCQYFYMFVAPVCQSDIRYHFPQVENCIQMSMFKLGNIKDFEKSVTSNPLVHLVVSGSLFLITKVPVMNQINKMN